MQLIPVDLYRKLLQTYLHMNVDSSQSDTVVTVDDQPQTDVVSVEPTVTVPIVGEKGVIIEDDDDYSDEKQESIDAIIDIMPKCQRRKARIILGSGQIEFQRKSLRVLYSGGEIGSHIMELLSYILAPQLIVNRRKTKPIDIDKFIDLLSTIPSIPPSFYNRAPDPLPPFHWLTM